MADDIKFSRFEGWHGTDEKNLQSILENNFRETCGDDWLGEGAYFFTKGIGEPHVHARNWVFSEVKRLKCTRYVVLKIPVVVCEDNVLDLRTAEGLNLFQEYYRQVIAKLRERKKRFASIEKYKDGMTIRAMKDTLDLEIVLSHMRVLFGKDREEGIFTRLNNCTFLCVFNPKDTIDSENIEVAERGNIPNP